MHRPVLLNEVIERLGVRRDGRYVDCTLGAGGHTEALLTRLGPGAQVLALDADADALARAGGRLAGFGDRCRLVHANFGDLDEVLRDAGWSGVDGILFDLGMSSDQVDCAERGFSFQQEGPLDMRMDRRTKPTAAEFLADHSEDDLAGIFQDLGEERHARRIARAIVRERTRTPLMRTRQLADLIVRATGGGRGRIHPATRVFMALRMAVNREMENLRQGLEAALGGLARGGRLAVISFHSVEDRWVKHRLAAHVGRRESLAAGGERWVGEAPAVRWITGKPVTPGAEEIAENPRARSAKLRVVERVE